VGFALNDFSSLRYLHRLNSELHGSQHIDLIPRLEDPKDLFGALAHTAPHAGRRRQPLTAARERVA
jgi:ornithine cyclodeaminase